MKFARRRLPSPARKSQTLLTHLRPIFGRDCDRLDGLRLDWNRSDGKGSWLLVRASNTEPIIRIIAEAPNAKEARSLCDAAIQAMQSV